MSKLQLVKYPSSILRRQASVITNVDGKMIETADEMFTLMYENSGIGLAGPQVGLSNQILVIDLRQEEIPSYVLINPRVTKREGEVEAEEGCLSLPDLFGDVKRAEYVQVRYVDQNGEEQTLEAEGLLARAIQHEIDHLNGVLFIDRLGETRRQLLDQQLRALAESAGGKTGENGR